MIKKAGGSSTKQQAQKVELLAPGGDSDCVKAAILAGADAVYCGLASFNARRRAKNLSLPELQDLVLIARRHACRIYLTLNTLIMEEELPEVVKILRHISAMGIDGVIVQDYGLLAILKEHFSSLEIHASTQMTTHNRGQYDFLSLFGVGRINLARELSLNEIHDLAAHGRSLHIKTEVFVHGAYCISFSGQCFMSSAVCGQSGNRGACVQPCRRTYFAEKKQHGKNLSGFLPFNLRDNSAFSRAAGLIKAGADSFKIEGRIKNFRYVYTTLCAWRKQIDRFYETGKIRKADPALSAVFNRCFSDGYLAGDISRSMFIDTSRDQSLEAVSPVAGYSADARILVLENDVSLPPHTEALVYTPDFTFICIGFLEKKTGPCRFRFTIEHKLKGKIVPGCILYKQPGSPEGDNLKKRIDALQPETAGLSVVLSGAAGEPLQARFESDGKQVTVRSRSLLTPAVSQTLSKEVIAEKLGKLGNTPFKLEALDCSGLGDALFLPAGELNDLRRRGVDALTGKGNIPADGSITLPSKGATNSAVPSPSLACLIAEGQDPALCKENGVTLLFELPVNPGSRAESLKNLFQQNRDIIPWFPPVLIGGDFDRAEAFLETIAPPFIITDNSGIAAAAARRGLRWVAGPLFNCTNSCALHALKTYGSCAGAFISQELSRPQIQAIAAPDGFELWYSLFNPLLLMNTRQCLVRNCLGCAKDIMDGDCVPSCSRSAAVYDGHGNPFFILKRPGFYNQVYNGRYFLNVRIIKDMPEKFSRFVIDLRNIRTETTLKADGSALVKAFHEHLASGSAAARLKAMIQKTTAGQYVRGI